MAAEIVITKTGNSVNIKDVSAPASHQKLNFTATAGSFYTVLSSDGQAPTSDDTLTIIHRRRGAVGSFRATDFTTPSGADFATLRPLVDALLVGIETTITTTYPVLLSQLQNGLAPAGQWVKVEDILDRGAYLLCTSATEVAKEGFGLFLNADFQSEGQYLASYSGHACSQTNYGQWRPTTGNFLIAHDTITGSFQAGEAITTATWAGVFVSDSGAGSMTAYSTGGNTYPLDGETITGAISGATCDQIGTAGLNQLTGGGVVVYQDSTSVAYKHYLCIDPAHIDGSQTPDKDPAYMVIDRDVASAGYIPVTDAIEYDFLGNDANTFKGWLISRKDASSHIRITETTALDKFGATYSILHTYPWGSDLFDGVRIDDSIWYSANCGDLVISQVRMAPRSYHNATLGAGCSVVDFSQEADTSVTYTLEAGKSISKVSVMSGVTLAGKTYTDDVSGFTVFADDTTTETTALPPFGSDRWKVLSFKITASQLQDSATFGTMPGIELFSTTPGSYAAGTVHAHYYYGTAPHTLVSDFVIRDANSIPLCRFSRDLINGATVNRNESVPFPSATTTTGVQSFTLPATYYLSTAGGVNVATGGGDGYIVVTFYYQELKPIDIP